jgi:nucleoside-diphosphate-sugar epimerase
MNILIAGGEGYLGSVLCNLLVKDRPEVVPHKVTSIDLGWFPTEINPKVELIRKNLFDVTDLSEFDHVVFLAGLSNDPMAEYSPKNNFAYNAGLPFYMAKLAKESGVKRFVYASSCSVYGWQDHVLTEEDQPLTDSYYGIAKLQGERAIHSLQSDNFDVASFRMGTLSGCSPRMRYDIIVNTMYMCAKRDNLIYVNNPKIWRPILHVEDAARVYQKAVEKVCPYTGVYNVAGGNYQVIDVAQAIQKKMDCEIDFKSVSDVRNYRVDVSKLGFDYHYDLDTIIDDLIKNAHSEFDSDKFFNIKVYEKMF